MDEKTFSRYLEQTFRRWMAKANGLRSCPAPDCPYVELLQDPRSSCQMKFVCQHPNCGKEYCYKCKKPWHPGQECSSNEVCNLILLRIWLQRNTHKTVVIFTLISYLGIKTVMSKHQAMPPVWLLYNEGERWHL